MLGGKEGYDESQLFIQSWLSLCLTRGVIVGYDDSEALETPPGEEGLNRLFRHLSLVYPTIFYHHYYIICVK